MSGRRQGKAGHFRPRRRGLRLMLRPALLLLIAERDSHGYELIEQLESLGFDIASMDSSILYRDLRDMEEMGLIQSVWDEESKGPRKRVYQINQYGNQRLNEMMARLERVQNQILILQKRFKNLTQ
jgi:poly-beta-hydroxybutyrate-responsive repressor